MENIQKDYKKQENITSQSAEILITFTWCNKCGSPITGCTCVPGDQDPENK